MSAKRRKRHGPEEIMRKLRDADAMRSAGKCLATVLRGLEVSEATYHRWWNRHGEMKSEKAKRMKLLVADLLLDSQMLKHVASEELVSPSRKPGATRELQARHAASTRRACTMFGHPQCEQRSQAEMKTYETALCRRLREIVRRRPWSGYHRITAVFRREG